MTHHIDDTSQSEKVLYIGKCLMSDAHIIEYMIRKELPKATLDGKAFHMLASGENVNIHLANEQSRSLKILIWPREDIEHEAKSRTVVKPSWSLP